MVIVEDDLGMRMPNGLTAAQHMAKKIELFTRKCYKSEGRMTPDSYQPFLEGVFQGKHHTGLPEHRLISVTFITDRGVSHEGVRHRMAAYLQESTRYCDYGDCQLCNGTGMVLVTSGAMQAGNERGDGEVCPKCNGKASNGVTYILPPWVSPCAYDKWATQSPAREFRFFVERLWMNERTYQATRDEGWPPEQSRGFLAHFVKTEYAASLNLGSWWNFLFKRTPESAHPQMRQLAIPLLRYFRKHLPMFFKSVPFQPAVCERCGDTGYLCNGIGEGLCPCSGCDSLTFSHKGKQYPEAKLVVNPYYDQVAVDEVPV